MNIGSGLSGIGRTVARAAPPPAVSQALRSVGGTATRAATPVARPTVGRALQGTARTVARRAPTPVRRAPAPQLARGRAPLQLSTGLDRLAAMARNAPSVLTTEGPILTGKASWFGGPNDQMAGPTTASGLPVSVPGIAVYNPQTLGGNWKVDFPNGRSVVLKQTDLGPAPWTGRKVDVLYSALPKAGYTEGTFPTDAQVRATYLGKG